MPAELGFQFKSKTFKTEAELEKEISSALDSKICFAVVFDDWDKTTKSFKVKLRYATIILPSTNIDPYSNLQQAPKVVDWEQWKNSGAL